MKIAIWLFANSSSAFGTTTRTKYLVEILKEKHKVTFLGDVGGIDRIPLMRTICRLLKMMLAVIKNRFDIILCASDFRYFTLCYPLMRIRKIRLIFDIHGIFSEEEQSWDPPKWRRRLKHIVEKFIVLSISEMGHFWNRTLWYSQAV
jgi:hypothetical protein